MLGIQRIVSHQGQHAEAVLIRPASAGRIDEEGLALVLKNGGTLVDVGLSVFLPRKLGNRKTDPLGVNGAGITHVGDVNVLRHVDVALPARPDEVIG